MAHDLNFKYIMSLVEINSPVFLIGTFKDAVTSHEQHMANNEMVCK
jgi:hypothetical protein